VLQVLIKILPSLESRSAVIIVYDDVIMEELRKTCNAGNSAFQYEKFDN